MEAVLLGNGLSPSIGHGHGRGRAVISYRKKTLSFRLQTFLEKQWPNRIRAGIMADFESNEECRLIITAT